MSKQKIKAKFYGKLSKLLDLVGGSPQGSLIGQDCFIVSSNDNSEALEEEDIFRFIDDLQLLEIVLVGTF